MHISNELAINAGLFFGAGSFVFQGVSLGLQIKDRNASKSSQESVSPKENAEAQQTKTNAEAQSGEAVATPSDIAKDASQEKAAPDKSPTASAIEQQHGAQPEKAPAPPENKAAHGESPEFQAEKQRALEEAQRNSPPPPPPLPPPAPEQARTR